MSKTAYMITEKTKGVNGLISPIDANNVQIEWEDNRTITLSNVDLSKLLESDAYDVEEVEVVEEDGSNAAATIIPHANADVAPGEQADGNPKTRLDWLLQVVNVLGAMDAVSLSQLYDQSIAINQAAEHATEGKAAINQSTIQMHPTGVAESLVKLQKEEQDSIFGESTLTEEAKSKLGTLFEAAVATRLVTETAKIEEKFQASFETSVADLSESLINKIDDYMNYVVTEWMTENKVATESALRNEITNEFIDKLHSLFVENYIDVPEDKVNVLEAIVIENDELKSSLNEKVESLLEKNKEIKGLQRQITFNEISEGMTLMQKDKLRTLIEYVEFTNNDEFKTKVATIKESVLTESLKPTDKKLVIETSVIKETVSTDPSIIAVANKMKSLGKIQ